MTTKLNEEQLNSLDKKDLIDLILNQQEQLASIDTKMQTILEQVASLNRKTYSRSTEKLDNQMAFTEVDGILVIFNEAETLVMDASEEDLDEPAPISVKKKKSVGKRVEDISKLPKIVINHDLTEAQLLDYYGDESYKRLPDQIYNRYRFTPAKLEIEEHHVAVYSGKESEKMIKAPHPKTLFRNSLASPDVLAGVYNGKYVNAQPLARIEAEMARYGMPVTRQNMANWVIQGCERYLGVFYDYMKTCLRDYHVIHADETPLLVNKDGRAAGSKSYMWVYRTGENYRNALVLYEYQKTRNASHPREFLRDFTGVCVTDGYQVYHTIEGEREDLKVAGCWAHARRRYDEALQALPKDKQKSSTAYKALKMIQAIFREDGKLKELTPQQRKEQRQLIVKPLVEAYFAWAKKNQPFVAKGKTLSGINYSINQEKYLRVFLEDGEVPLDNNAAERSIRGFCVGKKNWVMSDTVAGAEASAIAYSIAETAKANNLKPYEYFKYLLTVIPEHLDDTDRSFLKDLLPWSEALPAECRKSE